MRSSSGLHAAAPAQAYFVCPSGGRAKYCSAQVPVKVREAQHLRTAVLCSALNRADKVCLRWSRIVKTRRGPHLMKMGGAGPGPTAGTPLGFIGGLSTAFQNSVDKPLMPLVALETDLHCWIEEHAHLKAERSVFGVEAPHFEEDLESPLLSLCSKNSEQKWQRTGVLLYYKGDFATSETNYEKKHKNPMERPQPSLQVLKIAWHTCEVKTISSDYPLKLIKRMSRVCKAVIKAKGYIGGLSTAFQNAIDKPLVLTSGSAIQSTANRAGSPAGPKPHPEFPLQVEISAYQLAPVCCSPSLLSIRDSPHNFRIRSFSSPSPKFIWLERTAHLPETNMAASISAQRVTCHYVHFRRLSAFACVARQPLTVAGVQFNKKMKRANNLKEALCALCRVLSSSGSRWDPETLRKSKFDRPEAASEFWSLLFSLLRQIFPGNPDSSHQRHEKIEMADRVKYVKSVLQIQGYGRPAFYNLPDDGEDGSREILLAFSWLLHRVKILEILLKKKSIKVGDHITICQVCRCSLICCICIR
ncbi:unnamed protein product [Ranitomeya imitator]|uniref:Tubulin epsilon and delta complex protein 1 domain-containing protein n=1 Tax=Ranitomeya imitator TaxID=111125 RepID=A0ABN9L516_9NEOB|nr:unnamed protein product [Ranitomeya imitator]